MAHFPTRAAVTLLALSMLTVTADAQIFGGLRRDRNNQSRQNRSQRGQTHNSQSNPAPQPNPSNQLGQPQDSNAQQHSANRPNDLRAPDMGLWFSGSPRDSLVISDVSSRGPIAQVGFREGDRIVSVNGYRVAREADFIDYLLGADRDRVEVIVNRDGRDETIWVEPAQFTQDNDYQQVEPIEQFGVVLDNRYDDRIVVWRVIPRSPAFYAGIREGDVISTFDGQPYKTRTEFEKSVGDWRNGEAQLQVRRGDRSRDLTVDVPDFDRSAQHDKSANRNDRANDRDYNRANDSRSKDRNSDQIQQSNRDQNSRDRDNSNQNNSDRGNNVRDYNERSGSQTNDYQHGNQPAPNTSGVGGDH